VSHQALSFHAHGSQLCRFGMQWQSGNCRIKDHRLHCGQDLRIIKSRIAPFAWLLFGKLQQTFFDKTQY